MRIYITSLFLLITTLLISGCSGKDSEEKQPSTQMEMADSDHSEMDMGMGAGEPTDESIYNVSSSWRNRYNQQLQLSELRGKIQVLAMVYTHCEHACPRILADMKRIRDSLTDQALMQTNFVIVSIDPERDTPDRLEEFADENNLDEEKWTLLNGSTGDVLELAALLGVKYKRISDTDFTHSNMITVLNKDGEVVHQRQKLVDQPTQTISSIESLYKD